MRGAGLLVMGASLGCSVVAGALDAVSLWNAHRSESDAATMEASTVAQRLAGRIAACADVRQAAAPGVADALPPAAGPVPRDPPGEGGYLSVETDWSEAAFRCADFELLRRQRFRYEWRRVAPADDYTSEGEVHATADLDGDGLVDRILVASVACEPHFCTVSPGAELQSP